jgi:hypothetical protein
MKPRKTPAPSVNVVRAPVSVIEVLDRVLDRGIIIDAWLRVSVVGLTLVDIDARVVVASFHTYVTDGDAVGGRGRVKRPDPEEPPAKRPERRPTPRRRRTPGERRPKVMLQCPQGCTFLRASRRSSVRCPSDRARICAVSAV